MSAEPDVRRLERGRRVKPARRESPLAVVHWAYADGSVAVGCPLPRSAAQALVDAYQQAHPGRACWLETPPALR